MEAKYVEETLEALVYKEHKHVTALTLARHADVGNAEAMRAMADFYARVTPEQRRKRGLYAVYMLSGERKGRDEVHKDAVILVREADLEATKATFASVDECTLFSLQCHEVVDLHELFRADVEETKDFSDSDQERYGILFTDLDTAMTFYHGPMMREMKRRLPNSFDVLKASAAGVKDVFAFKQKQLEKEEKKEKAEHERLERLFQAACDREKTPKSSPKKLPVSPFAVGKKGGKKEEKEKKKEVKKEEEDEDEVEEVKEEEKDEEASSSPILKRKRQRKIMLDGEDKDEEASSSPVLKTKRQCKIRLNNESEEEDEWASSPKETEAKKRKANKEEKNSSEKKEEKKKRATIESDDDLFDSSDSPVKVKREEDEEEMEVEEVDAKKSRKSVGKQKKDEVKSRTLEATGALRRSPRKQSTPAAPSGPAKRFVQRDVEMEVDGMMECKTVMVEVELTEEELKAEEAKKRAPLGADRKTNVPAGPATKTSGKGAAAAKKAPAGQSKISSFFTKK